MSIPRTNPSNWIFEQILTDGYVNAIDKSATYAVDKRSGRADTISSSISVSSTGSLDFSTGSSINVNAGDLDVGAGNWVLPDNISGNSNPINLGTAVRNFTDGTDYTLVQADFVQTLICTGSYAANKNLIFPAVSGWKMKIVNQTSSKLFLKASGGVTFQTVSPGRSVIVFSNNGTEVMSLGPNLNTNYQLMGVMENTLPFDWTGTLFSNYSNILPTNASLSNVKVGDLLEVSFYYTGNMTLTTTASSITGPKVFGRMSPQIKFSDSFGSLTTPVNALQTWFPTGSQSTGSINWPSRQRLTTTLTVTSGINHFSIVNVSVNLNVNGDTNGEIDVAGPMYLYAAGASSGGTGILVKQYRIV